MVKTFNIEDYPNIHAAPDIVVIDPMGLNITYQSDDTLTFVVGVNRDGDLKMLYGYGEENVHLSLTLHHGEKLWNTVEGRLWTDKKIITCWNDIASSDLEVIGSMLEDEAGVDISDYTFVSEFDNTRVFAMSVDEFEKLGVSNNWVESDWVKIESEQKRQEDAKTNKSVSVTNKLGFDDKDYMRHYLFGEGKEKDGI